MQIMVAKVARVTIHGTYLYKEEVYIFLFLLECLRWGPTSLQTVMRIT